MAGTSALGTAVGYPQIKVSITGVSATGSVGSLTFDCEANVTPAGQSGTSALGTVVQRTQNRVEVDVQYALSFLGSVTVIAKSTVSPNGLSGLGELGNVNVWSRVDDDQTPNWKEVAA